MRILKQSTAVTVLLGPFLDKTDGVTEEAGLAGTGTELSKAGAAFGAGPTLGTLDSDGWYPIALTTTHTNTLGDLTLKVHDVATHLPVWMHFTVVTANTYDAFVSGTGVGVRADVQGWLGSAPVAVTTAGVPEVDVTHWVGGVVPAVTITGVPEVDVTHWIGTAAATPTVAGVPEVDATHWRGTVLPAPTVAGVPAVEAIDISAAGQTDIRAAVGLATANLDTQLDALPTAAENAGAVWNEDATTHQTLGTFGQAIGDPVADTNTIYKAVVTDAAGATVGVDVVAVQADTDNIQTRLPAALVGGRMDSDVAVIQANVITAGAIANGAIDAATFAAGAIDAAAVAADIVAEIVDAVWDEDATAHQTAGTFGQAIGDPVADANTIYGAVVTGATGATIAADIITIDDFLDTEVTAIKGKTDSLTFTVANRVDSHMISGAAGAITAAVIATGAIDADATSADYLAEINAEVVDALATDTYAEPGQGNPAATTTLAAKINYTYKFLRNRHTQDATTFKLYNDDATTVDQKAAVSDNGTTFDRGEIATGP